MRFPLVFHVSTVVFAQPVLRLVLAGDTQFYICSPTGEQGPGTLSITDPVPYDAVGCIHESVQARIVLLHAEVCEIVALTTGKER